MEKLLKMKCGIVKQESKQYFNAIQQRK